MNRWKILTKGGFYTARVEAGDLTKNFLTAEDAKVRKGKQNLRHASLIAFARGWAIKPPIPACPVSFEPLASFAVAGSAADRMSKAVEKQESVRQPRQRIEMGYLIQALFRLIVMAKNADYLDGAFR